METKVEEIWKEIDGYPDYKVSNIGRVVSIKFNKERIMGNGHISVFAYPSVSLCKDGKRTTFSVHRLVAQAFIPNPENKPHVNHVDSNPQNCHVSNLEWCTPKENLNKSLFMDGRWGRGKRREIYQFSLDGFLIYTHQSIVEAEKFNNFPKHSLSQVIFNKKRVKDTYKGYRWLV